MATIDLTLNNPLIRNFLEGKSEHVPVGELLYVHTHLVQENFLSQIETMILLANEAILLDPKKEKLGTRLIQSTNELMAIVHDINENTAVRIMYILKDIYKYCNRIIGTTTQPSVQS